MENQKENPTPNPDPNPDPNLDTPPADEDEKEDESAAEVASGDPPSRAPFTSLSQVDADLALARTLQEQERAYMMLSMGAGEGSDYATSEEGSDFEVHFEGENPEVEDNGSNDGSDYGEDAFDAPAHGSEIDPAMFNDDEAYARALQDAEEREVAVHLMSLAGINDWAGEGPEGHQGNSQDVWLEVDPDDLSYEELVALGEAVGTESRGLSVDTIAALPSINYKAQTFEGSNTEQCVICRLDFEDDDCLIVLSCKHMYHSECINRWLQINKVCPVCSTEVSTSENRQG